MSELATLTMPNAPHSSEYVSLRDYFDQRMAEQQRALDIATASLDKRLDGMNELRASMRDQASQFLPSAEFDAKFEALSGRLSLLERSTERTAGAVSAVRFLVVLVGAPGIAALLYVVVASFSGKVP